MDDWQVYLLKCCDDTLYCGITNDLDARVKTHNAGKGAKYTKGRLPVEVVEISDTMTKSAALKLEISIKKLPTSRKISALAKNKKI
jgi:putative endonuclease